LENWGSEKEKEQKKEKVQREKRKEFRKMTVEKEIEIARIIEEKQEEKKDLIRIRIVEEIIPKRFHKYLKVFEKKELERMLTRKTWDLVINLREGFVLKKRKIYPLSRIERKSSIFCKGLVEKEVYSTIEITIDVTSVFCAEERWEEEDGTRLSIFEQLDDQK